MQKIRHIAVLSSSLRNRSCNRKIAQALGELAPPLLRLEIVDISRLSPYTKELDDAPPVEWRMFRRQIRAADGVLFLAPGNSRGVPGVLKNALNIAAHPANCNAWEGKPGAIVNVSVNGLDVPAPSRFPVHFGAPRRLGQALTLLNVPVMQLPGTFTNDADDLFDVTGKPVNPASRRTLASFMGAFERWMRTYRH